MRRLSAQLLFLTAASLLIGCSPRLPATDYARKPAAALAQAQTQDTVLGRACAAQGRGYKGLSGFHLMPGGAEAFQARLTLVETAEKSIDMQYFSTRDDRTGKLLLEAILRAADRGVRVRLLLDGWNLDYFHDGIAALANHPGIEIRVFNPFSTGNQSFPARVATIFTRGGQIARRMHNKALIADNQMSVMGGRNLGDEYFGASADFNFRDMDVLAAGPIVATISANFDAYWNSREAYPVQALNLPAPDAAKTRRLVKDLDRNWKAVEQSQEGALLSAPLARQIRDKSIPLIWAKAEFTADNPRKIEQAPETASSKPEKRVDALADQAAHEFIVISPYFVPLDTGTQWLASLAKNGVHVRILTNSLASTDMVMASAAYSHYREALVEGGVDLYELKALGGKRPHHMFKGSSQSSLHAKLYVIDRRDLVVGSFNMDPRSEQFNTEQVLVIHSPEVAREVVELFDRITSPELSYHIVMAQSKPDQSLAPRMHSLDAEPAGKHLAWETEEHGVPHQYDYDPQAGFIRQLASGFFHMLPIDGQM